MISEDEIGKIIFFSEKILLDSIAKKGTSIVDFLSPEGKGGYQNELKVYARQGQKCQYYCGGFIISSFLNKRNTFYCPSCQT